MEDQDYVTEKTSKKTKNWGNGGGLYRGMKASVKTLNYIIIALIAMLIIVVIYLSSTSSYVTSFELNGGEAIPEIRNKYGEEVKATMPVKTGYKFDGWYQDKELTKAWDIKKDTVSDSMTLYAKWTPLSIKVYFDLNGGQIDQLDTINEVNVDFHTPYGTLPTPEKDGSTFIGWQYNGEIISAKTMVSMNGEHTLKAIYE